MFQLIKMELKYGEINLFQSKIIINENSSLIPILYLKELSLLHHMLFYHNIIIIILE